MWQVGSPGRKQAQHGASEVAASMKTHDADIVQIGRHRHPLRGGLRLDAANIHPADVLYLVTAREAAEGIGLRCLVDAVNRENACR